ncbi:unnamed protein product [Phytophthora fragariaefolia]|uniref:Unnamed protein product n=1 Tax=Phytophthora fragariaefolia TaxID=1490495 RepID=A0A9W6Y2H9_9STRA|nr:unnamed protein product [Phytophthora fragariaefolia]
MYSKFEAMTTSNMRTALVYLPQDKWRHVPSLIGVDEAVEPTKSLFSLIQRVVESNTGICRFRFRNKVTRRETSSESLPKSNELSLPCPLPASTVLVTFSSLQDGSFEMAALASTSLPSTYSSTTVASLSLPEMSASASMGASSHNKECPTLVVFLHSCSAKPTEVQWTLARETNSTPSFQLSVDILIQ